jgi:hypothetical protein
MSVTLQCTVHASVDKYSRRDGMIAAVPTPPVTDLASTRRVLWDGMTTAVPAPLVIDSARPLGWDDHSGASPSCRRLGVDSASPLV